jgi:hypothetical protein
MYSLYLSVVPRIFNLQLERYFFIKLISLPNLRGYNSLIN